MPDELQPDFSKNFHLLISPKNVCVRLRIIRKSAEATLPRRKILYAQHNSCFVFRMSNFHDSIVFLLFPPTVVSVDLHIKEPVLGGTAATSYHPRTGGTIMYSFFGSSVARALCTSHMCPRYIPSKNNKSSRPISYVCGAGLIPPPVAHRRKESPRRDTAGRTKQPHVCFSRGMMHGLAFTPC